MIYEPFVEGVGIVSPSQTLEWAAGDCVDFSFLLASLLIGAGYDAYVVYGRAPERIRLKCTSIMQVVVSAFMDIEIQDECNAQNPSSGDGTHSWILVKAGSRNVKEHTFIEPSTGILYPLCHSPYSQVSFICNNDNCWVGESGSIQEVAKFVCSEKESWRPILPANSVPSTWTNPITLSRETFLLRYSPGGKRSISLDKAKVELFGANANPYGVMCRVIEYDDTAQTVPVEITELFCPSRRADSMIQRTRHPLSNITHEHFSSSTSITERFRHAGKIDNIKFREFSRADGLAERQEMIEENGSVITERFLHRGDGLARRIIHISLLQKEEKKTAKNPDIFPSPGVTLAVIDQIA
jgi:hypothetical protein